MHFNDRSPLLIALLVSTVLCTAISIVLYLNEDWRQSTFALMEEEINEEGQIVKKVKVKKPEPKREQVREIARNQEAKKREQLKENARKLRKTVLELEEVVEARITSLQLPDIWDKMAKRANALTEQAATLHYWRSKSSFLSKQANVTNKIINVRNLTDSHSNQMRVLSLQPEVLNDEAWEALNQARRMVDSIQTAQQALTHAKQAVESMQTDKSQQKLMQFVTKRVDESKQLQSEAAQYLEDFEKLIIKGDLEAAENLAPQTEPENLEAEAVTDNLATLPDTESLEDEKLAANLPSDEAFEELEPQLSADETLEKPQANIPTDEAFESMETAELYESIQEMAQQLDSIYADNKAAELAEFKQMNLEEAKKQVFAPKTDTGPELKEQLSKNKPNTSEEFKAFNEALDQAVSSSERMSRQAKSRLDSATGRESSALNATQTAEQLRDALSRAASTKAKMAMAASNMGRAQGNLQDLRNLMEESYQSLSGTSGVSDQAQAGLSNSYDVASFTKKERSQNNPRKIRLNQSKTYAQALPGRRFDIKSSRKGWIFIDTWYIIGPWKLATGTKEFEPSLPPETMVDLDANYDGMPHPRTKKPMDLKWRFIQSGVMRIKPPDEMSDSVYFAYTEVFSESTMDVVVAVASDDRAKLWINDLVVFQDVGLSGWQLDEGFRRVLLKPGYNKLLVRLENGPAVANFSVLMCPFEGLNTK